MSASRPGYYEILGLPPQATPEQIKKKYRELARRYHPDVNSSPDAAQKIKVINEAYHVLGDPDRRSVYDAERLLRQTVTGKPASSASAPRPSPSGARPSTPPRSGPSRPAHPEGRYDFNGFGRTPPNGSGSRQQAAEPPPRPAETARVPGAYAAEKLVNEAKLAFINRRFQEAERLCREAVGLDRRNAVAHEILGDIHAKRGQREQAATAYSYAIQFNPRNISVQAKLERLAGRGKPASGPTVTRPDPTPAWQRFVDGPHRDASLGALSALLLMLFLSGLLLFASQPVRQMLRSSLSDSSLLSHLTVNLVLALLFEGTIAGILLAFYGRMRPISEELLGRSARATDRSAVSLGGILIGFACVWFYLSLLVYLGISILRNRISPSIMRAYGLSLLLVFLFACIYVLQRSDDGLTLIAVFGGNLLFPAILFGWAIGDSIRLRR